MSSSPPNIGYRHAGYVRAIGGYLPPDFAGAIGDSFVPRLEIFLPAPGSREARDADLLRREGEKLSHEIAARQTAEAAFEAARRAFVALSEADREVVRHEMRVVAAQIIAARFDQPEGKILSLAAAREARAAGAEEDR